MESLMKFLMLLLVFLHSCNSLSMKFKSQNVSEDIKGYSTDDVDVKMFKNFYDQAIQYLNNNPYNKHVDNDSRQLCTESTCRNKDLLVYTAFLRSMNLKNRISFKKLYVYSFEVNPYQGGVSKLIIATESLTGYSITGKGSAPMFR